MLRHVLASLLLLAAPALARAPAVARPALWEVSDADTRIYLFGTIHALPTDYAWRDPTINAVFARADGLVLETLLDDDPQQIARLLVQIGTTPGLPPLLDRVPPAKRAKLAALVARSGIAAATLDRFETWAAALMLFSSTLHDIGAVGPGVEPILKAEFAARHLPVTGLETPAEQLGYLDGLSEVEQRRFLVAMLDDPGESKREFAGMLRAWSRGDVKAIARTFDKDLEDDPALREALLGRRNANWARWIANRLGQPGDLVVAVGAGHLAGKGSVPELLTAQGYAVTRVQ